MKILLIRHTKAEPSKDWKGDDELRPLTRSGRQQAEMLARHFKGAPPSRIVSSPMLRCQQTVEPLTLATGISVDVDERLSEGEEVQRALELLPAVDEGPVLFCTHRDLIVALLRVFELTDAETDDDIPCKKGSVWVLEGPGYTPAKATYLEPPLVAGAWKEGDWKAADRKAGWVRAAALDLGSTSFNLLIAEVSPRGEIKPVVREKFMLRLGAVVAASAEIPEQVCERAVEVARELRDVAAQEKVQRLFPIATSALRDASNGPALAGRIGLALDTPVRVLSGEQEAHLIFRAFQRRLATGLEPLLGLDLGGGSLELAVGRGDDIELEVTLPLGVARLHRELVGRDPMRKREVRGIRDRVRELLAPHREAISRHAAARTVATGGTARALACVAEEKHVSRGPRPRGPLELPVSTLRKLSNELVRSSREERLLMRGMRKQRADLLPTGAVILSTLAEEFGIDHFTVSDWGLREGVLLEEICGRRAVARADD